TRVPELLPIRHGRMLVSPFTFYRGAALPMAADLATTPTSGLRVQLCGDAHLSNFGAFASPGRRLVFDGNDFDETLPGPFEWDVKRLGASPVGGGGGNSVARAGPPGGAVGGGGAPRLRRRGRRGGRGAARRAVPKGDARVRRLADTGGLVLPPGRRG